VLWHCWLGVMKGIWPVIPRLHDTGLSNRLYNIRLDVCLHDAAGCQTGLYTIQPGCQTGDQTGLKTDWMFVYTIQPVVNPVWQLVWQHVVSCKRGLKTGGWWRWALLSPDGVVPSWMASVSASVSLPSTINPKRSSGTGSPGWSRKKDHKTVYCGQMAGWMKTPLGTEADLAQFTLCKTESQLPPHERGTAAPSLLFALLFGSCLLWDVMRWSPISVTAELLLGNSEDITVTQEHWLAPFNVNSLDQILNGFTCYDTSGMNDSISQSVLRSCPFSEVAIFDREHMTYKVTAKQ